MAQKLYRQGDILFMQVDEAPEGKSIRREAGRIIIARGETTGHAHVVVMPQVKMIEGTNARYLVAKKAFQIVHEEHNTIEMPAGIYRIVNQREYSPEAIRRVLD